MDLATTWHERLTALDAQGLRRRLRTLRPTGAVTGKLDGTDVLVACSNDYLGLAWRDEVRAAAKGGGSGSSRLIAGDRPIHRQLEEAIEAWLGRPATLFTSGYHANLGLLGAIGTADVHIASDALNHASIIDGLRLSRARRTITAHADPTAVPDDADITVIEGLYSMDGDTPPIAAYADPDRLMVDEAHAIGCMGPDGAGAAAAAGVTPAIRVGTFGKALGAHGAFVEGPPELHELLVNKARSFIFTTGLPEPVAAMALAGLTLMRREPELADRLRRNSARLRQGLGDLGWTPLGGAHIVPIVVGAGATQMDRRLQRAGVFAAAIRPPTVAPGTERIRFTVSAAHTVDQIDQICDAVGPRPSTDFRVEP
ncbi:MAG: aminotransferase class I/II-fold pyridoxal phosphate-dependent enzyme [Myxococcota bacterium]